MVEGNGRGGWWQNKLEALLLVAVVAVVMLVGVPGSTPCSILR